MEYIDDQPESKTQGEHRDAGKRHGQCDDEVDVQKGVEDAGYLHVIKHQHLHCKQ